uniref:Uncharacterized protein n=1 Tax=Anguilla anguilla TaxID=7936 RepID=A0A0E9WDB5_ANGAN
MRFILFVLSCLMQQARHPERQPNRSSL